MIINTETFDIASSTAYRNENWIGAPWELLPRELEEKATEYAPWIIIVRDTGGAIVDLMRDTEAAGKWYAEQATGRAPWETEIVCGCDAQESTHDPSGHKAVTV